MILKAVHRMVSNTNADALMHCLSLFAIGPFHLVALLATIANSAAVQSTSRTLFTPLFWS